VKCLSGSQIRSDQIRPRRILQLAVRVCETVLPYSWCSIVTHTCLTPHHVSAAGRKPTSRTENEFRQHVAYMSFLNLINAAAAVKGRGHER
jgi:hypothetical protein